jgi:hypothetical protein
MSLFSPERVQGLNDECVLYWMQSSQRAERPRPGEYAIGQANELDQCLLVVFGLKLASASACAVASASGEVAGGCTDL